MTHNEEHLEHCVALAIDAVAQWRADHAGAPFTVDQVVADLSSDQRAVRLHIASAEGAELHLRATFDEVRFDYDAFSRRDWSRAIREALP